MKTTAHTPSPLVYALAWAASIVAPAVAAPVVSDTVGTHRLRVVESGQSMRLLSVPYLKVAVARGRLDSVDAANGRLVDREGAFARLDPADSHLLRIADGPEAGAWFLVAPAADDSAQGLVLHDGLAGRLDRLAGGEAFSIHPLFTLAELFGEADGLLAAGPGPDQATVLSFYRDAGFEEYWLSDGSRTGAAGWMLREDGGHVPAGESAILPGVGFFLSHPDPTEAIDVRVQGVVIDGALRIPVFRGYNFVAPTYVEGPADSGGPDLRLGRLGLKESGFHAAADPALGDKVLTFDDQGAAIVDTIYLDALEKCFRSVSPEATCREAMEIKMGGGLVILNTKGGYFWHFGR